MDESTLAYVQSSEMTYLLVECFEYFDMSESLESLQVAVVEASVQCSPHSIWQTFRAES